MDSPLDSFLEGFIYRNHTTKGDSLKVKSSGPHTAQPCPFPWGWFYITSHLSPNGWALIGPNYGLGCVHFLFHFLCVKMKGSS